MCIDLRVQSEDEPLEAIIRRGLREQRKGLPLPPELVRDIGEGVVKPLCVVIDARTAEHAVEVIEEPHYSERVTGVEHRGSARAAVRHRERSQLSKWRGSWKD